MNIVFDTSFLQSYLNKKDANFLNSREIFRSIGKNFKPIVPIVVVGELICGTKDEDSVVRFLNVLTNNKYEPITKIDINYLKNMDASLRRGLKSNDCFVLSICYRYNAELLTFDRKLQKAYDSFSQK